jgi:hypothetical protein
VRAADLASRMCSVPRGYADFPSSKSIDEAQAAVHAAGLVVLGKGSYGLAAASPDGRVLKFSLSEQDYWRDWIRLVADPKQVPEALRPWVPVVYEHAMVGSVMVAQIERLHTYSYEAVDEAAGLAAILAWAEENLPRGARMDVHAGNWLFRGDGQKVLTDP